MRLKSSSAGQALVELDASLVERRTFGRAVVRADDRGVAARMPRSRCTTSRARRCCGRRGSSRGSRRSQARASRRRRSRRRSASSATSPAATCAGHGRCPSRLEPLPHVGEHVGDEVRRAPAARRAGSARRRGARPRRACRGRSRRPRGAGRARARSAAAAGPRPRPRMRRARPSGRRRGTRQRSDGRARRGRSPSSTTSVRPGPRGRPSGSIGAADLELAEPGDVVERRAGRPHRRRPARRLLRAAERKARRVTIAAALPLGRRRARGSPLPRGRPRRRGSAIVCALLGCGGLDPGEPDHAPEALAHARARDAAHRAAATHDLGPFRQAASPSAC